MATRAVRYVGPFEIEPPPDAPHLGFISPGQVVEVDDQLADAMLQQPGVWEAVAVKPSKPAKPKQVESAPVAPESAEQEASE